MVKVEATSEINLKNIDLCTTNDLKKLRTAIGDITNNLQREGQPKTKNLEIAITRLQEANLWLTMVIHERFETKEGT